MTAIPKTGGGTVTQVNPALPLLEYEYSWNGQQNKCRIELATGEAKEQLKTIKIGDKVDVAYDLNGYDKTLTKVAIKGSKPYGGYGGGSKPKSPEERRSIERQKAADIVSRVYVACIDRSNEPVPKTFKEMMVTIREETILLADVLGEPVKGGQ